MTPGAALDLGGLQTLLDRVRDVTVACVGDLMLDRYVYGEVSRISPEAPIPVLKTARTVAMPGGVGNVARNVASLGGKVRLGAVVGADAAGDELEGLFQDEVRIDTHLTRADTVRTIVKTRFVSAGQQLLRLDEEDAPGGAEASPEALDGAHAILISDYAKGVVSADLLSAAHASSARSGAPIIVDPKAATSPAMVPSI